ncbi:MAG: hypothetical protein RL172_664 [Bacteroidota bacterium]|jgi:fluoroquinolone resistance protein
MEKQYFNDQTFDNCTLASITVGVAEFENCCFNNCDFSNASLNHFLLSDCTFNGCNLSSATLIKTAVHNVHFNQCKMMGLHWSQCNPLLFKANFTDCMLQYCSFYGAKLCGTQFTGCTLTEADFTEADCSLANFSGAGLAGALFDNSNLEKANFTYATHYSINPNLNKIKNARFSLQGIAGLLHQYQLQIVQ